MAKSRNFFAFLSAFAILIVCFVPAAASSTYDINGEWGFDVSIEPPPFTSLSADIGYEDVYFTCLNSTFTDIVYSDGIMSYEHENGNLVNVWDIRSGWTIPDYRYIRFETAMADVSLSTYAWLYSNALQTMDQFGYHTFFNTIVVGATAFDFSSPSAAPAVTVSCTASGATFTHSFRTLEWSASTSGEPFQGFASSAEAAAEGQLLIAVGESVSLPANGDQTSLWYLYPVYGDVALPDGTYSSTINVYSNDGVYERYTYTSTGEGESPMVFAEVTESGLILRVDGVVVGEYVVDDWRSGFSGFATRRNQSYPNYALDAIITIGGREANSRLDLYICFSAPPADISDVNFTDWLSQSVSPFFDFEFWPDLSIGDILWVAVSVGILFWFLKMTV